MVKRYQAATSLGGTGWPWCDAFVAWVCKKAGIPLRDPTASTVQSLHDAIKGHEVLAKPFRGCIALFDFPGGDEVDHTGFVEEIHPEFVVTIEGNTSSNMSGSQSNGGGVFRKVRRYSQVQAFYFVPGMRRPIPRHKVPAAKAAVLWAGLVPKGHRLVQRLVNGQVHTSVD
jgi:hypothetical protein